MFKRFARSPIVPFIGGSLLWAYMTILAHTLRWQFEGIETLRAVWSGPKGWMLATWHSRILLMPMPQILFKPKWPKQPHPVALMVSNSRDGEFTRRSGIWLGLHIIRGSAPTKKEKARDKRGVSAAREALQVMSKGGGIAVTIDGPRGPAEVVGIGAVKLAQQMNAPIVIYGVSANARRLNSWDRLLFPWPFARAAGVFDSVPTSKDMDSEALRQRVEQALKAATARADALAGLAPLPESRIVPVAAPSTPSQSSEQVLEQSGS